MASDGCPEGEKTTKELPKVALTTTKDTQKAMETTKAAQTAMETTTKNTTHFKAVLDLACLKCKRPW